MIWGLGGNDTNSVHMDDSHRRNVDQKIQIQKSSYDYNCIKSQKQAKLIYGENVKAWFQLGESSTDRKDSLLGRVLIIQGVLMYKIIELARVSM